MEKNSTGIVEGGKKFMQRKPPCVAKTRLKHYRKHGGWILINGDMEKMVLAVKIGLHMQSRHARAIPSPT